MVTPRAKPPGYPRQWSFSKKAGTAGNSRFLNKSRRQPMRRRVPVEIGKNTTDLCDDKGSEFKTTFFTKPHITVACTTTVARDDLLDGTRQDNIKLK